MFSTNHSIFINNRKWVIAVAITTTGEVERVVACRIRQKPTGRIDNYFSSILTLLRKNKCVYVCMFNVGTVCSRGRTGLVLGLKKKREKKNNNKKPSDFYNFYKA